MDHIEPCCIFDSTQYTGTPDSSPCVLDLGPDCPRLQQPGWFLVTILPRLQGSRLGCVTLLVPTETSGRVSMERRVTLR